jgi:hypothetical protein
MNPITAILLNKSGKPDLQSLRSIDPQQILIGTYEPLKLPPEFQLMNLEDKSNYSNSLNQLVEAAQFDWIFYIKQNESILEINESLPLLLNQKSEIFGFQIIQKETITKEPRLWNKKERKVLFKNPVFEKPNVEITKVIDAFIYQNDIKDPKLDKILENWKRNQPFSVDACYYKAFSCLSNYNLKQFKSLIANYLFNISKNDIPTIMARYYLALVQGIAHDETQEAIKNIVICLSENILMAEFWCFLGDVFTKNEKFKDAVIFYENAIILGSRRPSLDLWPIDIPKYNTYPTEMIKKCKLAMSQTRSYSV